MHLATRLSVPALCLSALTVHADTLTVCLDGTCDFTDIQAAIDAASEGDVLQISGETYLLEATLDIAGKKLTLRGMVDDQDRPTTRLDGQTLHRVVQCVDGEGPDTVFEHLVFQNGWAAATAYSSDEEYVTGGAALISGSSPSFAQCIFTGNTATVDESEEYPWSAGGAVMSYFSSATFTDCTFTNNSADLGGAVFSGRSSNTFTDCTFENNAGGNQGGALDTSYSQTTLNRCTMRNNSAPYGGAMSNWLGTPTLEGCTLTDNSADYGGGMHNRMSSVSAPPTLSDCTFRNNSAAVEGGGMHNSGSGSPTLTNCTLTNNSAGDDGGAMYNAGSSPSFSDSTICDNTPNQVTGNFFDEYGNCIADSCRENCLPDPCPADLDGDAVVGAGDLTELLARWGCIVDPPGFDCAEADLNEDGTVDGADLTVLLSSWGACQSQPRS